VRAFGTAGEMKSESRPSAPDEATAYQARLRHRRRSGAGDFARPEDWRISSSPGLGLRWALAPRAAPRRTHRLLAEDSDLLSGDETGEGTPTIARYDPIEPLPLRVSAVQVPAERFDGGEGNELGCDIQPEQWLDR
jgi:hypothetical protein